MSTNALRKESRPSDPLRRAPAGIWAVAFSSLLALSACDSKGSGATNPGAGGSGAAGAGGSTGAGGSSGGTAMGGMMSTGTMGVGGFVPMAGSSGTGAGGATDAGGDPGGTVPPVMESGMTTAKFCNSIGSVDGTPLEFVLEMGTTGVRFTASTGKCVPMPGQTCSTIPAGNIPFRLSYKNQTIGEGVAPVDPSKPLVVTTLLDNANNVQLAGIRLDPGETCESFDFPAGDGGAPAPRPDASVPTKK
jgi:hypothetical protein